MANRKGSVQADASVELLKDILITELAKADVPQREIRKIVGCDILRVSRIARHIKKNREEAG